jgi:hypothetical protein
VDIKGASMRINKSLKIPVMIFTFILLCVIWAFAVDEKEVPGKDEKITEEDTIRAVEIKIGDEGIYIRTESGKEYRFKKGEITDLETTLKIRLPSTPLPPLEPGRVRLPKGSSVYTRIVKNDIVKAGSDIVIEEDELVEGDVTGLGADVTVEGKVEGSVVAVGGDIIVTSTGEIEKDATSVGGYIRKQPGGVIRGEVVEVDFMPRDMLRMPFRPGVPRGFPFMVGIFKILFLLFMGLVVFSVAPDHVKRVKIKLEKEMLKSGLVGLLGEILILPIFILLIITIIGIPVAILVEPLLIILAGILGYTAASLYIGEKIRENTNIKPQTALLTVFLGIIAVELIPVLAMFIRVAGAPGSGVGLALMICYWFLIYLILTIGFGAVILTRFGIRPKEATAVAEQKPDTNKSTEA